MSVNATFTASWALNVAFTAIDPDGTQDQKASSAASSGETSVSSTACSPRIWNTSAWRVSSFLPLWVPVEW